MNFSVADLHYQRLLQKLPKSDIQMYFRDSDQNELYSNTFTASVTENSSTAYEFLEFKLPSDISNCFIYNYIFQTEIMF